jgi:cytochrome c-type biogenesis protein CcmH/NrfG
MDKSKYINMFIVVSVVFALISGISLYAVAATEDGIHSYNIGEFHKAEALFREVLKGDADDIQAGYYLGMSLLMEEKFKEALGIFQNLEDNINNKAVIKDSDVPTKGQVEIGLVRSYLGLKKYPEALKSLDSAEKAKADPVDIHTYKGAYYLEMNENLKAQKELETALNQKSQNPYTYYFAGITYLRLGHPAKAVEQFKVFLQLAPYAPEAEHAKFLIDTLC